MAQLLKIQLILTINDKPDKLNGAGQLDVISGPGPASHATSHQTPEELKLKVLINRRK